MVRSEAEQNFPDRILWSDEATFKLNGRVNRHNCVYWSDSNPHAILEEELNVPGITVWVAIWSGGITGPCFFDETVNSENDLAMLTDTVLPELENNPIYDNVRFIWQQDGAPPHYGLDVRNFLDNTFEEWVGRRGTVDWPPRSCDLTPCDFSMWGILKQNVFAQRPNNLQDLKQIIEREFDSLSENKDLCSAICNSVLKRCYVCIEQNGQHLERLL